MRKRLELHTDKKRWVGNRKDLILRGDRLTYSITQQVNYQRRLASLVNEAARYVKNEIEKFYDLTSISKFHEKQKAAAAFDENINTSAAKVIDKLAERFRRLFELKGELYAKEMAEAASKNSVTRLDASLTTLSGGLTIKTNILKGSLNTVLKASIQENVELIKSIGSQYFGNISKAIYRSITTNQGLGAITEELNKYAGISKRHARLVALDQTRKVYNNLNKSRMQSAGVKKFIWLHSAGGQKPRKSHMAMSGNIYSFENLPIINQEQVDKGYESPQRGIPGQAINCRCTMTPVVEFDEGEQDAT